MISLRWRNSAALSSRCASLQLIAAYYEQDDYVPVMWKSMLAQERYTFYCVEVRGHARRPVLLNSRSPARRALIPSSSRCSLSRGLHMAIGSKVRLFARPLRVRAPELIWRRPGFEVPPGPGHRKTGATHARVEVASLCADCNGKIMAKSIEHCKRAGGELLAYDTQLTNTAMQRARFTASSTTSTARKSTNGAPVLVSPHFAHSPQLGLRHGFQHVATWANMEVMQKATAQGPLPALYAFAVDVRRPVH